MGVAGPADGHAVQGGAGNGDLLSHFVAALGRWTRARLSVAPWASGLGLARTALALGSAATLTATQPEVLFATSSVTSRGNCADIRAAGLFCAVPGAGGELARWCAVLILLVVASGWRPRFTAIPHWYVSWSLLSNAIVPDGGDQLTANLTLLLIPVALTDGRRWHWQRPPAGRAVGTGWVVAAAALLLIQIQVAVVYFQSSVAKLGVREWADGTAMYYFLRHPLFGAPPWLSPITDAVTGSPVGVAVVTWAPLAIEFAIAVAILLGPRAKVVLLVIGIAFHGVIAVTMGLASFALAMTGALLLALLPAGAHLARRGRRVATRRPAVANVTDTVEVEPAR